MRTMRRRRGEKLDYRNQRSKPIRSGRRGDDRHRQRLLRQILAHGAAIARLRARMQRTRVILIACCGSVPMVAVIMSGVAMATVIVARCFSSYIIPSVTMLMQIPMATADDNRHKQIACRKNESHASAKTGHGVHQRGDKRFI